MKAGEIILCLSPKMTLDNFLLGMLIQFILKGEELEQAIKELKSSCEDRNLFDDLNFSEVGRANVLSIAALEQSKEYMISTDFVATAANAIAGLWGGN